MSRLSNVRRIIIEDFPKEHRNSIEKLSIILNSFMDDVVDLTDKKIDFDNLYQELITIKVIVDANGVPTQKTNFSTSRLLNSNGGIVISAANLTNSSSYLTSAPFVTFTSASNKLFNIKHVTGLIAGDTYELKLIIIGK